MKEVEDRCKDASKANLKAELAAATALVGVEISPTEEQTEGYLQSLTPAGELSAFLSIRGMCLREAGRLPEAAVAFAAAARLSPQCHGYQACWPTSKRRLPGKLQAQHLPLRTLRAKRTEYIYEK